MSAYPPSPPRQRRTGRRFLIALLVLVVLMVGADRLADFAAEKSAASVIQQRLGMSAAPDVSIDGFPLLTQMVAGNYDRVEVIADAVPAGQLGEIAVTVEMLDVQVEVSDMINRDLSNAVVGTVNAEFALSEAALSNLVGVPVTIDGGSDGLVVLSATIDLGGAQVPVSLTTQVQEVDGRVTFAIQQATAGGQEIPQATLADISSALNLAFDLPQIVDGLALTGVSVVNDTVVIATTAQNVPYLG